MSWYEIRASLNSIRITCGCPGTQLRALQTLAACGGPGGDGGARVAAVLRRMKGTPEQLAGFLRDRDGAPTVDNLEAVLAG